MKKNILVIFLILVTMAACSKKSQDPISQNPAGEDAVKLSNDIALNDSLNSFQQKMYYFNATPGKTYRVSWNDSYEGDGTKTADIFVAAYKKDKSSLWFYFADSGYNLPQQFTVNEDKVYVKVMGYDDSAGTFSITVKEVY